LSRSTKLTDLAMCPNRGDRDLEQFGGHETDTFLRHDYATNGFYPLICRPILDNFDPSNFDAF